MGELRPDVDSCTNAILPAGDDGYGQSIGWVIVGGISLGTVLTLFVIPTAYVLIARTRKRIVPVEHTPEGSAVGHG